MIRFTLRERVRRTQEFLQALDNNIESAFHGSSKRMIMSARRFMRRDTGAAQRSLKPSVKVKGLSGHVLITSDLIQAYVDAYGRKKGKFPDTRYGSPLYNWAARNINNYLVADPKMSLTKAKSVKKTKRGTFIVKPGRRAGRREQTKVRRFAYLVGRSIQRRGIKASEWNSKALKRSTPGIKRDLENAIRLTIKSF